MLDRIASQAAASPAPVVAPSGWWDVYGPAITSNFPIALFALGIGFLALRLESRNIAIALGALLMLAGGAMVFLGGYLNTVAANSGAGPERESALALGTLFVAGVALIAGIGVVAVRVISRR